MFHHVFFFLAKWHNGCRLENRGLKLFEPTPNYHITVVDGNEHLNAPSLDYFFEIKAVMEYSQVN